MSRKEITPGMPDVKEESSVAAKRSRAAFEGNAVNVVASSPSKECARDLGLLSLQQNSDKPTMHSAAENAMDLVGHDEGEIPIQDLSGETESDSEDTNLIAGSSAKKFKSDPISSKMDPFEERMRSQDFILNSTKEIWFDTKKNIKALSFKLDSFTAKRFPSVAAISKPWENLPQFSVITGRNGSGKTQLLQYINESLTEPRASLGREKFLAESNYLLKREIIYVDPDSRDLRSDAMLPGVNISYQLDVDRDRCLEELHKHYNDDGFEIKNELAKKIQKKIDRNLEIHKHQLSDELYIDDIISKYIDYELRLHEPISFIKYLSQEHGKRIEYNKKRAVNVSGFASLYQFYKELKDEELENLHEKYGVTKSKFSDMEGFFIELSTNE
ncbi:MAG TPA: hypothetical protein VD770_05225, partial [Coxiellaceae bacterium]|nr:hypothetical protein [Coxiellaceae bacterium]